MRILIDRAMERARKEEPWDGYYMARGAEIEALFRFVEPLELGRVLDIGCGNGFEPYLLSSRAKKVVAADLYAPDAKSHSPGMEAAKGFFSRLAISGIPLVAASIEDLPFRDGAFDTVFAAYLLQYLKEKRRGLEELRRVTKTDGVIILMLPNFLERVWAFFQHYLYLVIKAARFLSSNYKEKPSDRVARFKEDYRYFPFPGPHGAYRTGSQELVRHMPGSWNRELERTGFRIRRSFTTTFMPYPLLLTISLRLASVISSVSRLQARSLGAMPILKYLGYNYCVILEK